MRSLSFRGGITLGLTSLVVAASAAAQTSLTGAGATFPNPIYTKWFDAYNKKTGVQVNYQSIGSGGGIRQFTEGTVDFGATDGPMNDDQIAAVKGNPDAKLPKIDIIVVHPSDGSGNSFIFTDFLSKVASDWEDKVGKATSVN